MSRTRLGSIPALTLFLLIAWPSPPPALRAQSAPGADDRTAAAAAPELGRQVLTADDIRRHGIGDLSELVLWLDGLDVTTVDGFTWRASPSGLRPFQDQDWSVLVDGRPVDLALFDVQALGRLPLTLADIDSVELIGRPAFGGGALLEGGILHLHTSRDREGTGAHGWFAFGNQTGDPGPFRFTELSSPNVNKEPPDFGATVTYGSDDIRAAVTGVRRRHHASDPENRTRNRAIFNDEFPHMTMLGGTARIDLHPGGMPVRAEVSHSELEDFFLLEPLGRELPLTSRHTRAELSGDLGSGPGTRLRYHASYGRESMRPRITGPEFDPDWTARTWRVGLAADGRRGRTDVAGAVELSGRTVESRHATGDPGYTVGRVSGRLGQRLAGDLTGSLGLMATAADGAVALDALAWTSWRPGSRHRVEAAIAWTERLPEEDDRLWSWSERGYGYAEHLGLDMTVDGGPRRSRTWTADAGWRFDASGSLRIRAGAYARAFSDQALKEQIFQLQAAEELFSGPARVETDAGGSLLGLRLGLEAAPAPPFELDIFYRHQQPTTGDPIFRDAWRPIPRHRVRATIDYLPFPGLELRGSLHYRTATRWPDYEGAAEASDGFFRERLRERLWFDLSIGKWLWEGRLRGNLLFRNLFDTRAVRFHPIGKAYDLGIYLQLDVQLGSGRESSARRTGSVARTPRPE